MNCTKSMLVPVIALMFLLFCNNIQAVQLVSGNITASTNKNISSTTTLPTNSNETSLSNVTYLSPTNNIIQPNPLHFGPMVKRMAIVAIVLSTIVALYFVIKVCRTRKRKARKYGVVKTPGDVEMRPLESDDEDDDDDDDVTMFDRKH